MRVGQLANILRAEQEESTLQKLFFTFLTLFIIYAIVFPNCISMAQQTEQPSAVLGSGTVGDFSVHPDEELILFSDTNGLWTSNLEALTMKEALDMSDDLSGAIQLEWSPDGGEIAIINHDANKLFFWDYETKKYTEALPTEFNSEIWLSDLKWSSNGQKIAVIEKYSNQVIVFNADTKMQVHSLESEASISNFSWSPDNVTIAVAAGVDIGLWNTETAELLYKIQLSQSRIARNISWSPSGDLIAIATVDGFIFTWALDENREKLLFSTSASNIRIAWSPDGLAIAFAYDGIINITDKDGNSTNILQNNAGNFKKITWQFEANRMVSLGYTDTIKVWNIADGTLISQVEEYVGWASTVTWSPDQFQIASGSSDGAIRIWDVATSSVTRIIYAHTGEVRQLAWCPCHSYLASSGSDKEGLIIWDVTSGTRLTLPDQNQTEVKDLAWSSNGEYIASLDVENNLSLWHISQGNKISSRIENAVAIAWNYNNEQIAILTESGHIYIQNLATGDFILEINNLAASPYDIAWSGSKIAVSTAEDKVGIWNVLKNDILTFIDVEAFELEWSLNGNYLALGHLGYANGQGYIQIFDATQRILTHYFHTRPFQISWSPDSKSIASADFDGFIRIWDVINSR